MRRWHTSVVPWPADYFSRQQGTVCLFADEGFELAAPIARVQIHVTYWGIAPKQNQRIIKVGKDMQNHQV